MKFCYSLRRLALTAWCLSALLTLVTMAQAGEYLVADRVLGRVLRYDESGNYLGDALSDPSLGVGVSQQTGGGIGGMTLSPDQSKLFITNRLANRIQVYNFNGVTATPAGTITAGSAAPSTIFIPANTQFSADGNTIFVANLGADQFGLPNSMQVARLKASDYTSAGGDLTGGPATGRGALALAPDGDLLVGTVGFFGTGGVLRYDGNVNPPSTLITPAPELSVVGAMLVHGNDLFVASGGGNRVGKFNVNTGAIDMSFDGDGYVTNLPFAASLAFGPGGNSFLVGELGAQTGQSQIDEYDFNGNFIRTFASNTHGANFPNGTNNPPGSTFGFSEPTAIVHTTLVPEPATVSLVGLALVGMSLFLRRTR